MIDFPDFPPWAHVVSISGGKDSTALYLLALERMQEKGREFIPVFADTGNEHEAVYDAVNNIARITNGPEPIWVRADLSHRVLAKRKVVETKWVSEGVPDDIIERTLAALVPTGNAFLDLCLWKGRFPSSRVRFCTEELKVKPIALQVYAPLLAAGRQPVSWQGVRKEESFARSLLPRWQRVNLAEIDNARIRVFRPLLEWKIADVWAMHDRHRVARNPLYDQGMNRVGCMPCIMAKKSELREIASRFPNHIDRIVEWEALVSDASKRGCSTFFAAVDDPTVSAGDEIHHTTHGIRRMVEWSKTSRGGRQLDLIAAAEFGTACDQWGACE